MVNSSGQTPIDRAKANNSPDEIITLLENEASGVPVVPESDALEASWVDSGRDDRNPFKQKSFSLGIMISNTPLNLTFIIVDIIFVRYRNI